MKRIFLAMAVCMGLALAPAASAQEISIAGKITEADLPDVDARDPASCDVRNGWMTVYKQFLVAWNDARDHGRLSEEVHRTLLERLLQQDAYYSETGDAITLCRQQISWRRQYGF